MAQAHTGEEYKRKFNSMDVAQQAQKRQKGANNNVVVAGSMKASTLRGMVTNADKDKAEKVRRDDLRQSELRIAKWRRYSFDQRDALRVVFGGRGLVKPPQLMNRFFSDPARANALLPVTVFALKHLLLGDSIKVTGDPYPDSRLYSRSICYRENGDRYVHFSGVTTPQLPQRIEDSKLDHFLDRKYYDSRGNEDFSLRRLEELFMKGNNNTLQNAPLLGQLNPNWSSQSNSKEKKWLVPPWITGAIDQRVLLQNQRLAGLFSQEPDERSYYLERDQFKPSKPLLSEELFTELWPHLQHQRQRNGFIDVVAIKMAKRRQKQSQSQPQFKRLQLPQLTLTTAPSAPPTVKDEDSPPPLPPSSPPEPVVIEDDEDWMLDPALRGATPMPWIE